MGGLGGADERRLARVLRLAQRAQGVLVWAGPDRWGAALCTTQNWYRLRRAERTKSLQIIGRYQGANETVRACLVEDLHAVGVPIKEAG